jgi:hypothetical protein
MKDTGIIIANWKLPIFKKHLDAAGFTHIEPKRFTGDTLVLQVRYEWAHKLQPIIEAANAECARERTQADADGEVKS